MLAGGRGSRLTQLTDWRAKPAVPFGGKFRIIDFRAVQLRQLRHPPHRRGHAVQVAQPDPAPAARLELPRRPLRRVRRRPAGLAARWRKSWYQGTADAVYQNLDIMRATGPDYVLILAGDHIYKMDYGRMLADHVEPRRPT